MNTLIWMRYMIRLNHELEPNNENQAQIMKYLALNILSKVSNPFAGKPLLLSTAVLSL